MVVNLTCILVVVPRAQDNPKKKRRVSEDDGVCYIEKRASDSPQWI